MPNRIHYNFCPVCGSDQLEKIFSVKDYMVSDETFPIEECCNCKLRFTQDVPDAKSIQAYYKSENYISHTDSSKGFINKLYKWVRKRTLKHKRKLIEGVAGLRKGNILDVGSGTGAFVHEMKLSGWKVNGLEPDTTARAVAQKQYGIELNDLTNFIYYRIIILTPLHFGMYWNMYISCMNILHN